MVFYRTPDQKATPHLLLRVREDEEVNRGCDETYSDIQGEHTAVVVCEKPTDQLDGLIRIINLQGQQKEARTAHKFGKIYFNRKGRLLLVKQEFYFRKRS